MAEEINLIVAGVGGQGSILASHIIAMAALKEGLRARVGETFGAAMRGGAVASHVRIGKEVASPLVPKGGADVILALEPLEGLRTAVNFLKNGGLLITNVHPWLPVDVNIGRARYPTMEEIKEGVKKLGGRVIELDGTAIAQQAGNVRAMNSAMLGALAATGMLPFSVEALKEAVKENVPPKTIDVNLKAFDLGFERLKSIMVSAQS
ncbi:MAG: indolepyruvate ferredoxin oxidoreductase subunit beta [Candidatus Hadarchaeales archaeon]